MKKTVTIGAKCSIRWLEDNSIEHVYVSFGNYDEDTNEDGYGVNDRDIFSYSDDVAGMAEAFEHEFRVVDFELVEKTL